MCTNNEQSARENRSSSLQQRAPDPNLLFSKIPLQQQLKSALQHQRPGTSPSATTRIYPPATETRNFPFSSNSNLPFSIRDPEFPLQQQPESTLQQDSPSAATRIYPSASETLNLLFRSRHPKSPLQQRQTELPSTTELHIPPRPPKRHREDPTNNRNHRPEAK